MTPQVVMELAREAVWTVLLIASPLLLSALAVGLLISIFQAATQINEATLSFIPKIITMLVMLVLAGPWILQTIVQFMRRLFESIPFFVG